MTQLRASRMEDMFNSLNGHQLAAVNKLQGSYVLAACAGCLSGETVVELNRAGKSFKMALKDVVYRFNGGIIRHGSVRPYKKAWKAKQSFRWNPRISTQIRARNPEGFLRLYPLAAAIASGKKVVFEVRTSAGKTVRATEDHRFLTAAGWKRLKSIPVGTLVYVSGGYVKGPPRPSKKNLYRQIHGMQQHPHAVRRGREPSAVPEHRLIFEAHLNGLGTKAFIKAVRTGVPGLRFLDPNKVHVHHLDEDPTNNKLSNLALLPPDEHFRKHGEDGGWKNVTAQTVLEKVVSIREVGVVETYDLRLKGPPHNFIANGFVVHNSGKTRTVILRMLNLLLNGVPPRRIGAFTFARDAAKEMQDRGGMLGFPSELRIGTLHSLCWEIVQNDGQEFDGPQLSVNETKTFYQVKTIINFQFKGRGLDPSIATKLISLAKANCLSFHPRVGKQFEKDIIDLFKKKADKAWLATHYASVFQKAEEFRTNERIVDFDDMLILAWLTLTRNQSALEKWQSRFDYLLVDEAQDSSRVQNAIVDLLAKKHNNIMLIGDLSQSIYSWRGARPRDFQAAAEKSELLTLPVNYRSTQQICAHATKLVADKTWNLTGATIPAPGAVDDPNSAEAVRFKNSEAEAEAIAIDIKLRLAAGVEPREIAILYRVTWLLIPIERALMKAQIPYSVWSGMNFFERREVRDLIAYLRVAAMRDPDESNVKRALNAPFRYISKALIGETEAEAYQQKVAFLDALRKSSSAKPRQQESISEFYALLIDLNQMVGAGKEPKEVLNYVLSETKYLTYLKLDEGEGGPDPEGGKAPNVYQLVEVAEEFSDVGSFLDYVDSVVVKAASARKNKDANAVVLSSIHRAKGIEWNYVYGVGWNMGILPHALNPDPDEELRLAYVCLTRARKRFQASFYDEVVTPTGIFKGQPSTFIARAELAVRKAGE